MGLEIDRADFTPEDFTGFSERLEESLAALADLLARPGFGEGPASIGAELEVSLVDGHARPLPFNRAVLAETVDPRLTYELDRFNLESNLRHGPLAGAPLTALRDECVDALEEMQRAAAVHHGRVAMIGILPTLTPAHLEEDAMTDSLRYRALSTSLRRMRRAPFAIDIRGDDTLSLSSESVAYEGAGTSFQVHLRVAPKRFARVYNAIQLATPVTLAASGNSPIFLGRRLWHETRIALFKQAVDPRRARGADGEVSRVSFGTGWVDDPLQLFTENVRLHPPLLPVLDRNERPGEAVAGGGLPSLRELRLHQGTVWRWNRAIYDPAAGGHLRIELRSLPAGPTVADMLASLAFQLGVALDIARQPGEWTDAFDFARLHSDFYRAAQSGLEARLHWPGALGGDGAPVAAPDLIERLLPLARRGLEAAGIAEEDALPRLETFARRARERRTGATWQRRNLERSEATRTHDAALAHMLEGYLERSEAGDPVDAWTDLPA